MRVNKNDCTLEWCDGHHRQDINGYESGIINIESILTKTTNHDYR